jgi:hypothetical protein
MIKTKILLTLALLAGHTSQALSEISRPIAETCKQPEASNTCSKNLSLINPVVGKSNLHDVKVSLAQCAGLYMVGKVAYEMDILKHPKGNKLVADSYHDNAKMLINLASRLPGNEDVIKIGNGFSEKIMKQGDNIFKSEGNVKRYEFLRDVTWIVYLQNICNKDLLQSPQVRATLKDVNLK